ncbi:MAG: DUF1847 domain-containing protein [Candidatus Hermodarchaeota archaeon]
MTKNSEDIQQDKNDISSPTCFKCDSTNHCSRGKPNKSIGNCPMIINPEIAKEVKDIYDTDEFVKNSIKVASIVEAQGYIHWPRLKDTIEYAKGMKYTKLGIASCVGLQKEAELTAEILEKYGFQVYSVCCKTGAIPKTNFGVPKEFTMMSKTGYPIGFVNCNPVAQALLLNKAKTDMNIIIGLCVGHDITFTHLSDAPVTTFIAKDRSNPHNPATILYTHYGKSFIEKDLKTLSGNSKS